MHLAAAWLGCKRAMVGTGWANSHPGCMDRPRKYYPHLVGGSFVTMYMLKSSLKWGKCRYMGCFPPYSPSAI